MNHQYHYQCEDCWLNFTIHGVVKRPACPSCALTAGVKPYIGGRTEPGALRYKKQWTKMELKMLQLVVDGKLSPMQLALRLGRSANAVSKKLQFERMRQDDESRRAGEKSDLG